MVNKVPTTGGFMKYDEILILLPCHSIEDFPMHHEGDQAEGLLGCWSALWHPALIASAQSMPAWRRVGDSLDTLADRLIVVPEISLGELPTGFSDRVEREGGCLIQGKMDRDEIVAEALGRLDGAGKGVDAELAADFLALGYCYLQVELLTRQMRYASNLDEVHFQDRLVAAAGAAVAADDRAPASLDEARDQLRSCFDILSEERDHYYPVDANILDLTLVAPTTLGAPLRKELASPLPVNLLISGSTLVEMAETDPESLQALCQALASDKAGIIGGEFDEVEIPLLGGESILAQLRRGLAAYQALLGQRPQVYGRRRYGLSAVLPQILKKLGFTGAIHATLDDGRFPEGNQARTEWEGFDGTPIDTIARVPLDASRPETFLTLASKLGESMDTDHVATVAMAHWPGRTSRWYDDLRRVARYVPVLGKWSTVGEYFHDTGMGGQVDRFKVDQYRSPYLAQAVRRGDADPISGTIEACRRRAKAEACQSLATVVSLLGGTGSEAAQAIRAEVESAPSGGHPSDHQALDDRLSQAMHQTVTDLARRLPRGATDATDGYLIVNPCSFGRRIGVELAELPAVDEPILAAGRSGQRNHVVVDVPSMGFAWVAAGKGGGPSKSPPKPLAEENVLRNEYVEAWIDPTTGTLRAVYDYRTRGNRLSQQLALRAPGPIRDTDPGWDDPEEQTNYSVMAADSVEVTASSAALGEITTSGRLLDRQGNVLATYRQRYQLWRGSRVLRLDIQIDPRQQPGADPWNSYYACRFAWADSAADLYRSVHLARRATTAKRIEATHFVEIHTPLHRTAILTGGLPYHRRVGMRMLDSLLIVRGERASRFNIGIGFDLAHPLHEALGLLQEPVMLAQNAPPPTSGSATWLFHVNAKNVVATHWEPLLQQRGVAGFRVRLLETAGRKARVFLRSFRPVRSATQVDFLGEQTAECEVSGDRITAAMGGHQWIEIEAQW